MLLGDFMEISLIILMPIVAIIAIVYMIVSELKCKLVGRIWVAYSCLIIPLFIIFIPFLDGTAKFMFGINEKVQDIYDDMTLLHSQLQDAYNSETGKGNIGDNSLTRYYRTKEGNLCVNAPGSRTIHIRGKIFFTPEGVYTPKPHYEDWKSITWNKNLLFMSDYRGVKDYLSSSYFRYNRSYILGAVLVAIQCIFFFFIFKKSLDKVNIFLLLLLTVVIPVISLKNFGSNYLLANNPYSEANSLIKSFAEENIDLGKILKGTKKISKNTLSYDTDKKPEIFVSKKPFFPYNYVRINLGLLNYLFYFPDDKVAEVNPLMDFKKVGNHFWLGTYNEFYQIYKESRFIKLICRSIIWTAFMIMAVCILLKRNILKNFTQKKVKGS
jgi:hypothetical protein